MHRRMQLERRLLGCGIFAPIFSWPSQEGGMFYENKEERSTDHTEFGGSKI